MTEAATAAPAVATSSPAKADVRRLGVPRFREAAVDRNVWAAVPEAGVDFAAVLQPAYWTHVAAKLRPGDMIEVRAEDGTWFAILYVVSAQRLSAKVVPLPGYPLELDAGEADEIAAFGVKWNGPQHRWAVVRVADKRAMQTGFQSREDAHRWLADNLKSLGA